MNILFTGATGRVGTPLLRRLAARGDCNIRVATPDRPPSDIPCDWVETDFRKNVDFDALVAGVETVCHLGAEIHDAKEMQRVNVEATRQLAEASERAGVKLFLYTSSTMVYGYPQARRVNEGSPTVDATPFPFHNSLSIYGDSKLASEKALASVARACCYVVLRPTMLVDDSGIVNVAALLWLRRLWRAHRYTHLIHVEDVAVEIARILDDGAFATPDRAGRLQVFNFSADAEDDRFLDLFAALGKRVALPRWLITAAAASDRLKDGLKWRKMLLGWPYGAVEFAPDKLRAAGITVRSLRRRLIEQRY